jgi:hypothetical protein
MPKWGRDGGLKALLDGSAASMLFVGGLTLNLASGMSVEHHRRCCGTAPEARFSLSHVLQGKLPASAAELRDHSFEGALAACVDNSRSSHT